ncbi:hypothetical protein EAG_11236 [Camponotus floridanus]|uniref:Uncharacterized protein n=1 Tax=Camponotus floridanus TaxID=104421 RepID=E2A0P1_CAMFO|nr:DNA-directed RNA polymerase II subunit GRINL1A [Camponotus floridanus]XP_011268939.1 DNA-directed RNA polymerase II subunit GRINL1A [Camponotus floridanus]EFN72944.1 hypothetical protein EAG_11236 [Camponotus floridanus]
MSKNIIKKIPGDIPLHSKKESQGYIEDLEIKQKFELEELVERQNKILANKQFISKLPDKGEKIVRFRDKLLKELEHRNEVETAANLLSQLNIASIGKAAMTKLEWTGKYNDKNDENTTKVVELDSDDEEDPLKILAQPTGTGVHKKKIIHIIPEESLIKPEDIVEIESFKTDNCLDVEHVKYIIDKVEKAQETNKKKEPFKPYKTTKSNVHDPIKEKQRKLPKNWEVTAATPPLIIHDATKVLSINESLRLQTEQTKKLQEIQTKHAIERLTNQIGMHNIGPISQDIGNYQLRHTNNLPSSSSSSDDEEEYEVQDEEDNDRSGTVVFTVDSIES